MNSVADLESRSAIDASDWMLFVDRFRALQAVWPSEVDLFSAAWNRQLPKFVSWIPQPNATAECLLSQLGESTSVRFSPVGIDSEMPLEDQERECGSRPNLSTCICF